MGEVRCQSRVSVIIPTRNGEKSLTDLFAALDRQDLRPLEILVGDTASSDATVEICRRHGATIVPIGEGQFDHGGTRSQLAKLATGEIVVFFTQDAIPAATDSLRRLITPLKGDIACSYGRQLPNRDATPFSAHLRLFNYPPQSSIRSYADRERFGLKTVFVSNSFAAYRQGPLEEVGYFKNNLIFGEDTCTLGRLLLAGYRVAYVSEAAVYHSHNYSLVEEFRRSFDIGVLHSTEKWLLATYGRAEGVGGRYVCSVLNMLSREKKYHLLPDCILRIISKAGGYTCGRFHAKMPARLRPLLSMNRAWWQG